MVVMWGVYLVEAFANLDFGAYGVYPREVFGLRGVLFAPLIHDDFRHLLSNSAPSDGHIPLAMIAQNPKSEQ